MSTMGKILIALGCLAVVLPHAAAGESATVGAKPTSLVKARAEAGGRSKPMIRDFEQSSQRKGLEQKVAFAASHAVGADKALLRRSSEPGEIVIDLLVAYTRKAAEHYYEIEREVVEFAIEEANHSFRLSGIGHIRLRLAHTFQTPFVERGSHFDQVWSMADKDNEHMRRIHTLRETYRADVAILIVDDASGCGLATRVGADADEAFAVVHHECAVANYTVAHEIGHLLGARHELGYVSGTSWRDIMSSKQECGGSPGCPCGQTLPF
jgi:hypothetical protein